MVYILRVRVLTTDSFFFLLMFERKTNDKKAV